MLSQFVLEPGQDASELDPLVVLQRKPLAMKSEEEKSAEIRIASVRSELERQAVQARREAEIQAAQDEKQRNLEIAAEAEAARRATRIACEANVPELNARIQALQSARYAQERQKSGHINSSRTGSIRTSHADLERELKAFDSKIADLRRQIAAIESEVSTLAKPRLLPLHRRFRCSAWIGPGNRRQAASRSRGDAPAANAHFLENESLRNRDLLPVFIKFMRKFQICDFILAKNRADRYSFFACQRRTPL